MKKKLVTNMLEQNVFVRDTRPAFDKKSKSAQRVYYELVENITEDGINYKLEAVDYPITQDYVDSFADSTNYKKDPAGAVARAPQRQNLGNISDMQKASEMDSESLKTFYKKMYDLALKASKQVKPQPKNEQKEGEK